MLPPAALRIADRLVTALMTAVCAVVPIVKAGGTPTLPKAAAQTLLFRLGRLLNQVIRIRKFGVRTPTKFKPTTQAAGPAPIAPTRPNPAASLPRRPGWLLAALPEIASAIAADLDTLLADPAIATLLNAAPTLHRTLRPLLRGLGLDPAPPTPAPPSPAPSAPPPVTNRDPPPPNPAPPPPESKPVPAAAAPKSSLADSKPLYADFITISK